ncbi:MAG: Gfo/Idh/MocA family oxidoreductase [Chthoniobacter sp.]|uniref:Gfo/Idh/MocA family protein n=1 Tax=Chthoniobacter sp. TaxID=2510640 RepID=UPI0032A458B6
MSHLYRVGIIGSTNRGGYGHGMDTAFKDKALFEIVGIADDDPTGLAASGKRLGVTKLYVDYREMLAKEKPEIVGIGPRWVSDRVAMVTAAAEAGCHIFLEKPLAANLRDADAMLAACQRAKVKCGLAHQLRAMPPLRAALADIRAGKYGKVLRLYGQPSDDARGGGEELIVHGTHFFDLMISLVGPPRWVSAHFATGERDATLADKHEGREPVGPIVGDSAAVMIGFDHGVRGFWNSTANLNKGGTIYGLTIQCEQATICMRTRGEVFIYPGPVIEPENDQRAWQKVWVEDWHFTPEHQPAPLNDYLLRGNQTLVRELVAAIERDTEPSASLRDAVFVTEIIQGAYASHFADGRRLAIPLVVRRHPLEV